MTAGDTAYTIWAFAFFMISSSYELGPVLAILHVWAGIAVYISMILRNAPPLLGASLLFFLGELAMMFEPWTFETRLGIGVTGVALYALRQFRSRPRRGGARTMHDNVKRFATRFKAFRQKCVAAGSADPLVRGLMDVKARLYFMNRFPGELTDEVLEVCNQTGSEWSCKLGNEQMADSIDLAFTGSLDVDEAWHRAGVYCRREWTIRMLRLAKFSIMSSSHPPHIRASLDAVESVR